MHAIVVTRPGGPEVLELADVPEPRPKHGEVLLDVVATAVNRADLMQRAGHYPPPPGASDILGLECSGRIAELGDGVTGWSVGDVVCALLSGGGYAQRVAVPAPQLMRVPDGLDVQTAGALPEVACTVWATVIDSGRLAPGERFLVHGGSSGIGMMAIQVAKASGAAVFATAGSTAKVAACLEYGADVAVNYREQDFVAAVAEHSGGAGVDLILDTVGAKYLSRNLAALATDGRIEVIGMLGGTTGELNLASLLAKRGSIHAASLRARPLVEKAAVVAGTEAHVWPLIVAGRVRPVIDRVLPLADAAEAHRVVAASEHIGKVVLAVA